MKRLNVSHQGITDLASDLRKIATRARGDMEGVIRSNAGQGNRTARAFARESAGKHGKWYPDAFSVERIAPLTWEYGPEQSKVQGGMSFEYGSRNQKPHLDLNRSADIIGPELASDARSLFDKWFWPHD